jgi:hypothetical protein
MWDRFRAECREWKEQPTQSKYRKGGSDHDVMTGLPDWKSDWDTPENLEKIWNEAQQRLKANSRRQRIRVVDELVRQEEFKQAHDAHPTLFRSFVLRQRPPATFADVVDVDLASAEPPLMNSDDAYRWICQKGLSEELKLSGVSIGDRLERLIPFHEWNYLRRGDIYGPPTLRFAHNPDRGYDAVWAPSATVMRLLEQEAPTLPKRAAGKSPAKISHPVGRPLDKREAAKQEMRKRDRENLAGLRQKQLELEFPGLGKRTMLAQAQKEVLAERPAAN